MNKQKLVMVGNGMAGVRTIEELIKNAPEAYEITIFGNEPHPNYNRIKLSNVLQGEATFSEIIMNELDWYKRNDIQLSTGDAVSKIDPEKQVVYTENGQIAPYDKLILATGSSSFILPVPGAAKEGVTGFRDILDTEMMIEAAKKYKKAVVIGGGLLGLEAARGLLNLGMEVDVVHLMPDLMERQLDPTSSNMLKKELAAQGMNFLMEKETVEILGESRVTGVRFKDGSETSADLVVMAIGIKPNTVLAKDAGIYVNRGIVINDFMETSMKNVYAVGECAEHREITYGLVAPLYDQARVLAAKLAGIDTKPYAGSVTGTQLKVAGVDLFSAGEILDDPSTKAIKIHNEFDGIYKKVLIRNNQIVGIVLYGDTKDSTRLFRMLQEKEDISGLTSMSLLPPAGGEGEAMSIAAMPDSELVCGCNGVTKGTIVEAIRTNELTTVEQVGGCTNAGRSCGRCKSLISDILAHTLGEGYEAAPLKTGICGCTALSRDEIVAEIQEKGLTSIKEVMYVLGWKQEEGCIKCRPAINYFLGMVNIDSHRDDRDSRLVNEKMHANIQKDGTYSVVPRMYGGVTSAEDLKKIAAVAEKYNVPLVKLTGGQRIGLFGIKKENLPDIWKDLDMPSGYAYGKTLRTVKTCVGAEFCRYGTQNSMALGIELEKKFERLDTPHKVKMGVSACPRNCAESGIKDIGFIGIDGGWEIYVAGNGGMDLRAGDLLMTVKTQAEVMEITGAYLQYYRETANYLERTSKWLDRVGLDHVKEVLADEAKRKALNERVDKTLERYEEPWSEAVENQNIQDKYYTTHKL
ncbi:MULTISPECIES: nitrite reductase large subunit NirB [unclassified Bacillus (in: firmicutes)]|uniref:nitrite reductase large subunit NirB n=1 Tax=unclassified Bacillus (in: firmicutes) TaxID=185979 RepID=UPI0008E2E8B4|nr:MULTISPECIES: nitrite reductase large subunit NirB [unclassified Bacillus (in: firmicutes)]SFB23491.1 assimilatory nitrite reductase (NAD(P)H) large subunit precursor [Bacillus sp. UNCCL13]SFQ87785.1 assimilatory nitrite reductase (NAD(P)H) large subunit precursor [Bacillus sp. cl95]